MMRRALTLLLVMIVALGGALIAKGPVAAPPARADHVNEPEHPIVSFELIVENYADNFHADCVGGTTLKPKIRIEPIAAMSLADWQTHDPSEHFSIGIEVFWRGTNPKTGEFVWNSLGKKPWPHSNIPAHTESSKFNVAYATTEPGEPNGGWTDVLVPGRYHRVRATLLADVSGNFFAPECEFWVGP